MARLCPLLNAKIRHTQIEICMILKYLQQNHSVGIYKHVFERCQTIRSARRRAGTPEHHTTGGCVWLLSILLILWGWMSGCWARAALTCLYAQIMRSLCTWNWLHHEMIRVLINWRVSAWKKSELLLYNNKMRKLVRQIRHECKVVFMTNSAGYSATQRFS